jgi:predicted dehydrogenase
MNECIAEKLKNGDRPLLKIGFLGTGWIGRHRMECIANSAVAEVAWLYDSSPASVTQVLEVHPDAKVAACFDELLDADLDGIVIATPSALHAEQSIRALQKGLAVFCQKPLGRNAPEVASIIRAAKNANRLLGIDLSYRFTDGMQQIHRAIASGAIGEVYACDLTFHNAYGPDKAWFYDSRLSGGGCVMDLGVHLVDLALWTLGFPRALGVCSKLFASGKSLQQNSKQVEDYGIATIELSSGTVVRLACSWKLPVGCDALISAVFYGLKGGLSFHNVNGSFYDFVAEQFSGTSKTTLSSPPDEWGGRAAVAWATRLQQNACFDEEVAQASEVAAILDTIYGREERGARNEPTGKISVIRKPA